MVRNSLFENFQSEFRTFRSTGRERACPNAEPKSAGDRQKVEPVQICRPDRWKMFVRIISRASLPPIRPRKICQVIPCTAGT